MAKPRTLYDKIWDDHMVDEQPDGTCLLYIDRHLVHEVTSPQAFEGLRLTGRKVRAPEKTLAVVDDKLPEGVTAKDIILAIIGEITMSGGTGHVIEYTGEAIRALSMEGRMTVCNMSIEGGARAGMVAPDEKTFEYLKGRPKSPKGGAWENAMRYWETLHSDEGAAVDTEIRLAATKMPPIVTWGTNPGQVVSVAGRG